MDILNKNRLEKYSAYKDSGDDRIKHIPQHWQMRKGKWLYLKNDRPIRPKDEIVTCFRDGQVTLRKNRRTGGFTTALKEHGYQGIRKGDLVIHQMDAFAGAIGVSDSDGKSTPVYSVCTERIKGTVNNYFYAYYLKNLAHTGFIESLAKGIRERSTDFRFNDFSILQLVYPPLKEQTRIANFLDDKCSKIDQAIQQKEQLIELLQERKQIIIQNAVTRGLNPDVKMKDSGVDWIGAIPEGWEVKRLKHLYTDTFSGGTPSTEVEKFWDGNISWISSADVKVSFLEKTLRSITSLGLSQSSSNLATKGSVIIVTRSGILQHTLPIAILMKDMAINQDIKCFVLNQSLLTPNYLLCFVKGKNNEILVETRKQGATVESIDMAEFANLTIPVPTIKEQHKIIEFVNDFSNKIDTAINLQTQQIKKLKEYKQVLINEVVTGKVKV